jgi:anti-anti-sigma regulatory factor
VVRIQRDEVDAHAVALIPQGPMTAEWAEVLERECEQLSRWGFRVVLDLSELVVIGRTGIEVLRRLSRAKVGITGCSPLIASMLEQEGIPAARASAKAAAR